MEALEIAVDAVSLGGEIAFELFVDNVGAAGDDVFDSRGGENHSMTGVAREINRVNAFTDAQDGEDFVEDAVAFVGETAGEMEADVEGDSFDAEAREGSAEDGGLFQEKDAFAVLGEDARGGQSRDSAADDDGIVMLHGCSAFRLPDRH